MTIMNSSTPLIFRASATQRIIAAILALGCLLVATQGASLVFQNLPKIWYQIKLAHSQSEPTMMIWLNLVIACLALLFAGFILLMAVLAFMLIEGTQVIVDEFGITVACPLLPKPIAHRLGAGRILWADVTRIERRLVRFVLFGREVKKPTQQTVVAFLLVDELDKLIFLIIEQSPNLKLNT